MPPGRFVLIATAILCISACAQPLMHVPDELAGKSETYRVQGRQGLLVFEPQIAFGPFHTVSIHRGISEGEHSSHATGVFSSEEHDSSREQLTFVLEGPSGGGAWRGRCLASSESRSEAQVTGVHFGSDGSGLTREQTAVASSSGYVCQLDGPSRERWMLEADARLHDGTVRDAAGGVVATFSGSYEKMTWQHPALEGNAIVGAGGEVWASVQRSFDGAVSLSLALDPKQRTAAAAICTALLIPGP